MLNMFTSLITGLTLIAGLIKGSKGNMMYALVIVLAKPQTQILIHDLEVDYLPKLLITCYSYILHSLQLGTV